MINNGGFYARYFQYSLSTIKNSIFQTLKLAITSQNYQHFKFIQILQLSKIPTVDNFSV